MKHLKYFENNRNKIINFCGQAEDIVNFEPEFGDYETSNVDILSALGDLANDFDMSEDDLKLAIKDLLDHNHHDAAKMVGIILDDTIKNNSKNVENKIYDLNKIKKICYEAYMSRTDEKEYRTIHRKDPKVEFEKWFEKNKNILE